MTETNCDVEKLERTVREIATENPATVRVFERLGIDYCCGGKRTLAHACALAGVAPEQALDLLAKAVETPGDSGISWDSAPLGALTAYIAGKHHAFARREGARIEALLRKVVERHGAGHPELTEIEDLFGALSRELSVHMLKEEAVLFPHIEAMEREAGERKPASPACFASVSLPIARMTADHDDAGALLLRMRELSNGYAAPESACPTYLGAYRALEEFEQDLHRHVHLENNVLFPRAIEMEARAAEAAHAR